MKRLRAAVTHGQSLADNQAQMTYSGTAPSATWLNKHQQKIKPAKIELLSLDIQFWIRILENTDQGQGKQQNLLQSEIFQIIRKHVIDRVQNFVPSNTLRLLLEPYLL